MPLSNAINLLHRTARSDSISQSFAIRYFVKQSAERNPYPTEVRPAKATQHQKVDATSGL
jgi:hypothetical protein